jgi:hypothetical protein
MNIIVINDTTIICLQGGGLLYLCSGYRLCYDICCLIRLIVYLLRSDSLVSSLSFFWTLLLINIIILLLILIFILQPLLGSVVLDQSTASTRFRRGSRTAACASLLSFITKQLFTSSTPKRTASVLRGINVPLIRLTSLLCALSICLSVERGSDRGWSGWERGNCCRCVVGQLSLTFPPCPQPRRKGSVPGTGVERCCFPRAA